MKIIWICMNVASSTATATVWMLTAALTHSGDIILGMRACTFLTMFTALSVAVASLPINKAGQSPWAPRCLGPQLCQKFYAEGQVFRRKSKFFGHCSDRGGVWYLYDCLVILGQAWQRPPALICPRAPRLLCDATGRLLMIVIIGEFRVRCSTILRRLLVSYSHTRVRRSLFTGAYLFSGCWRCVCSL